MKHENTPLASAQAPGYEKVDLLTRDELVKTGPEKHLKFWEKVKLRFRGRFDGKAKLPALHNDEYCCPFLTQESKAYSEYECKIWTRIQSDLYPLYSRALKIIDDMKDADEKRRFISSQLPPYPTDEELSQIEPGEEKISPIAVRNRRLKAYKNEIAKIKAEIYSLIGRISSDAEELSDIYNSILESEKAARILCEARRDRCQERVAVYWRAAIKKNKALPPVPFIKLANDGEALYDSKHKSFHEAIRKALTNKYEENNNGGNNHEN